MTEAEWLAGDDPLPLVQFAVTGPLKVTRQTRRKRYLFAAACCRLVWPLIAADPRLPLAVDYLETDVDEAWPTERRAAIWDDVKEAARHPDDGTPVEQMLVADLIYDSEDSQLVVGYLLRGLDQWGDRIERSRQIVTTIRDVVGNPFRPVPFDPRWRTSDAVGLARAAYEDRAFNRIPLLADALMDAGCADDQILEHCRGPGPHVRGCWVVDLVLDKE